MIEKHLKFLKWLKPAGLAAFSRDVGIEYDPEHAALINLGVFQPLASLLVQGKNIPNSNQHESGHAVRSFATAGLEENARRADIRLFYAQLSDNQLRNGRAGQRDIFTALDYPKITPVVKAKPRKGDTIVLNDDLMIRSRSEQKEVFAQYNDVISLHQSTIVPQGNATGIEFRYVGFGVYEFRCPNARDGGGYQHCQLDTTPENIEARERVTGAHKLKLVVSLLSAVALTAAAQPLAIVAWISTLNQIGAGLGLKIFTRKGSTTTYAENRVAHHTSVIGVHTVFSRYWRRFRARLRKRPLLEPRFYPNVVLGEIENKNRPDRPYYASVVRTSKIEGKGVKMVAINEEIVHIAGWGGKAVKFPLDWAIQIEAIVTDENRNVEVPARSDAIRSTTRSMLQLPGDSTPSRELLWRQAVAYANAIGVPVGERKGALYTLGQWTMFINWIRAGMPGPTFQAPRGIAESAEMEDLYAAKEQAKRTAKIIETFAIQDATEALNKLGHGKHDPRVREAVAAQQAEYERNRAQRATRAAINASTAEAERRNRVAGKQPATPAQQLRAAQAEPPKPAQASPPPHVEGPAQPRQPSEASPPPHAEGLDLTSNHTDSIASTQDDCDTLATAALDPAAGVGTIDMEEPIETALTLGFELDDLELPDVEWQKPDAAWATAARLKNPTSIAIFSAMADDDASDGAGPASLPTERIAAPMPVGHPGQGHELDDPLRVYPDGPLITSAYDDVECIRYSPIEGWQAWDAHLEFMAQEAIDQPLKWEQITIDEVVPTEHWPAGPDPEDGLMRHARHHVLCASNECPLAEVANGTDLMASLSGARTYTHCRCMDTQAHAAWYRVVGPAMKSSCRGTALSIGQRRTVEAYASRLSRTSGPKPMRTEQEVLDHANTAKKRRTVLDEHRLRGGGFSELFKVENTKAFLKTAGLNMVDCARVINGSADATKVASASHAQAAALFAKLAPIFTSGLDSGAVATLVATLMRSAEFGVLQIDGSAWDSSINQRDHAILALIYMLTCEPQDRAKALASFEMTRNNLAKFASGLRFDAGASTNSGTNYTSVGNGHVIAFMMFMAILHCLFGPESAEEGYAAEQYDDAWRRLGFHSGDDVLMPNIPNLHESIDAIGERYGKKFKVKYCARGTYCDYLAVIYGGSAWDGVPDCMSDVPRALNSLAFTHLKIRSLPKKEQHAQRNFILKMKLKAKLAVDRNTPYLGPVLVAMYKRICDETGDRKSRYFSENDALSYRYRPEFAAPYNNTGAAWMTQAIEEMHPNLDVATWREYVAAGCPTDVDVAFWETPVDHVRKQGRGAEFLRIDGGNSEALPEDLREWLVKKHDSRHTPPGVPYERHPYNKRQAKQLGHEEKRHADMKERAEQTVLAGQAQAADRAEAAAKVNQDKIDMEDYLIARHFQDFPGDSKYSRARILRFCRAGRPTNDELAKEKAASRAFHKAKQPTSNGPRPAQRTGKGRAAKDRQRGNAQHGGKGRTSL